MLSCFDITAYHNNAPYHTKRNLRVMCEVMYGKLSKNQHEALYRKYAHAGVAISAENATTYTCPIFASLISLSLTIDGAGDERILCVAYGSGCAASMYGLSAISVPVHRSDVLRSLQQRNPKSTEDALFLICAFEMTHRCFGFQPSHDDDR